MDCPALARQGGPTISSVVSNDWETSQADMSRLAGTRICISALCLLAGCSSKSKVEEHPRAKVMFQEVQNPQRELCTDDTLSRTEYINVPLVRLTGTTIALNGLSVSERELLDWAQKKYKNLPEQALWVQISPDNGAIADRALLPLVQSLPQLQLRRVAPEFSCPKLRKGR
jgi:hypothetical protein